MIEKILVFGAGYVGGSLSVLLSKYYKIVVIETDQNKITKINNREYIFDGSKNMSNKYGNLANISASKSYEDHVDDSEFIILALPTNYDEKSNFFDTTILESVLENLNKSQCKSSIIIKSTVPIGFTESVKKRFVNLKIFFVPEFLREGSALEDNTNPSRIVIGDTEKSSNKIAELFLSITSNRPSIFFMQSNEAEAVKLFANTYLATRVSFFNELDSFAMARGLNTKSIIDGVSSDPRIGNDYNNPSFGYGGYCLPKDTKQLLANFTNIPQDIFSAVVNSNNSRKKFIASEILAKKLSKIGIFRLIMKKGSENFRESAIFDIIKIISKKNLDIIVYEPLLKEEFYNDFKVTHDLDYFKNSCDLILTNRMDIKLKDVVKKVYTRDIYGDN